MTTALRNFKDAVLAKRIASIFVVAMEHASPEALKEYLHEHPGADKANHTVEKKEKSKGKAEEKKPVDHALAEGEGKKSQARFDDNKKLLKEQESLKAKVDDGNQSALKKFTRNNEKLLEAGEKASVAAKKLISKYEKEAEGMEGEAKEAVEATLDLMSGHIADWDRHKLDLAGSRYSGKRLQEAKATYGYAQQLEAKVKELHNVLKDPDHVGDQSWRG